MDRRLFLKCLAASGVSTFVPQEVPTRDVWDWDNISCLASPDGSMLVGVRVHGIGSAREAVNMIGRLADREVFGSPACGALVQSVEVDVSGGVTGWLRLHKCEPMLIILDADDSGDCTNVPIYKSFDASNIWFETVAA
ncbi:MAG: hypothetical protein KDA34_14925 [Phycisphaerales bacterium]|nr:hypothetical protein [Phycisphaerales bacterium]